MGKILEEAPIFSKAKGNAWREELAQIKPVLVPATVKEALSPKVLEKVNDWWMAGKCSAEIIRLLGLTWDDPRWLAIRKELLKQVVPENETEALLKSYQDQDALLERMTDLLNDLDAKIDEKPLNDEDRKAQHHFYKYKLEVLKELLANRSDKFRQFMEVKKLNKETKDGLTVQILIQNNIPRPEKLVEAVAKVVKK